MKMADPVTAVTNFNPMDICARFFAKAWTHSNQKLVLLPSGSHKSITACRNVVDLALQANTHECSANEWRYFTLMSIFSSLTGVLSLLSLYLYIKIQDKIKESLLQ